MIAAEDAIYARGVRLSTTEWVLGTLLILSAIEFTRRTTGWIIPVLIMLALSYVAWWGSLIGGVFSFGGLRVETVLFRIIRGTGIAGLRGMPVSRPMAGEGTVLLLRPLLALPGTVVRQAAEERDLAFVDDPTNATTLADRNRLRLELIPHLRERYGDRVEGALETLRHEAAATVRRAASATVRR